MGQYYVPTIQSLTGEVKTLYSHDFGNGLKLMEHSYIGNQFVNAALLLLSDKPSTKAWIGDYSKDPYKGLYAEKLPRDEFNRFYDMAWDERDLWKVPASFFPKWRMSTACTLNTQKKYLVNHRRREVIHMRDYIEKNLYREQGDWVNGKYDMHASSEWCIHPLPLLTACGNDRGGGDFYDGGLGYGHVGLWAFDVLEYATSAPKAYKPVMFTFMEASMIKPLAAGGNQ